MGLNDQIQDLSAILIKENVQSPATGSTSIHQQKFTWVTLE